MENLFENVRNGIENISKAVDVFDSNIQLITELLNGKEIDMEKEFKKIENQDELLNEFKGLGRDELTEEVKQGLVSKTVVDFEPIYDRLGIPSLSILERIDGKPMMMHLSVHDMKFKEIDEKKYNLLYGMRKLKEQYLAILFSSFNKNN